MQFRWTNAGYRDFADFLATFSTTSAEGESGRRKVAASGVAFVRKVGAGITAAGRASPITATKTRIATIIRLYLSSSSSSASGRPWDNVLMALGYRGGIPVCAALDVSIPARCGAAIGARRIACPASISRRATTGDRVLHRAADRAFRRRRAGCAQARARLTPVPTWSAHAIADPEFARAIGEFCARERVDVEHAVDELGAASPFKHGANVQR
jgi:predicted N-acyltransferase